MIHVTSSASRAAVTDRQPTLARPRLLRIGDVAARTGVSVEALRYYERRGLLVPAGRRSSGYREYAVEAVALVQFIKRTQALGFSLAEVEQLVHLRERAWRGDAPRRLRDAAAAKVQNLDRQMRALRALRGELAALLAACDAACPVLPEIDGAIDSDDPAACPLVDALDAAVEQPASSRRPAARTPPTPGRRSVSRAHAPAHSRSSRRKRP